MRNFCESLKRSNRFERNMKKLILVILLSLLTQRIAKTAEPEKSVIVNVLTNSQTNIVLLLTIDKPIIIRYITVTNVINFDENKKTVEMKKLEFEIGVKNEVFRKKYAGLPKYFAGLTSPGSSNSLDYLILQWKERDVALSNLNSLSRELRKLQILEKEKELKLLKSE